MVLTLAYYERIKLPVLTSSSGGITVFGIAQLLYSVSDKTLVCNAKAIISLKPRSHLMN